MKLCFLGSFDLNKKNLYNLVVCDDKKKATKLSVWDKFLDLFKSCKKQDVLNTFYNLIHGEDEQGGEENNKFYRFEQLKRMADIDCQHLFGTRVENLSKEECRYTFSIGSDDIVSFYSKNNGESLAKLKVEETPLIDGYERIVFDYMKNNEARFLAEYQNTKTDSEFGADELMDYSCFFLKNNVEIRRVFFEHGLMNIDVIDFFRREMDALSNTVGAIKNEKSDCFLLSDSKRTYILTTICCSLIHLYQLDSNSDYM